MLFSSFTYYLPLLWLVLSIIGLLIDSYVFPQKGALFFSIGSLSIGILLITDVIASSDIILQIIIGLAVGMVAWFILKKKTVKKGKRFSFAPSSIIGEIAKVGNDDIIRDLYGVVHFEGKLYTARIADHASECSVIKKGQDVEIVEINGTILKVIPHHAPLLFQDDLIPIEVPELPLS